MAVLCLLWRYIAGGGFGLTRTLMDLVNLYFEGIDQHPGLNIELALKSKGEGIVGGYFSIHKSALVVQCENHGGIPIWRYTPVVDKGYSGAGNDSEKGLC